ncbi:LytTR family DNA-binding domain-containing protein [Polaribacter uvawellassae]|uniref:LytTR family DNA-binding domain-containing protein n=1 Tax=Polaribacter uvawellassae TaxID=3133495 RepID=UPI00321AC1A3
MKIKTIENHNIKTIHLAILVLLLVSFVIGKDFLHASIQNYSFYLSESLLFGTFWILFIPLAFINKKVTIVKHPIPSLFLSSLLHISIFSLFVYVISELFLNHTFAFNAVFINSISENGIVCLLIYGVLNYGAFHKKQSNKNTVVKDDEGTILVRFQNRTIVVSLDNIIYIKSEKPYISLVTRERKYLHSFSLKRFLVEHSSDMFIQIHKSTIINKNDVVSFNSRKNGDYDVQLTNQEIVRASRSFRNNFKHFL